MVTLKVMVPVCLTVVVSGGHLHLHTLLSDSCEATERICLFPPCAAKPYEI